MEGPDFREGLQAISEERSLNSGASLIHFVGERKVAFLSERRLWQAAQKAAKRGLQVRLSCAPATQPPSGGAWDV